MADYLYVVQMDIPPEHEADFNRVYDTEHVPNLLKVPGVHGCARYRLESSEVAAVPRYAAVYEIDSPEVVTSAAWNAAAELGDWASKIRPHATNRTRSIFKRIAGSSHFIPGCG